MKTKYIIVFKVSAEKLLPSVGKTIDSINSFMEGCGFNEKITIRSDLPFELTTARPLTPEEETLFVSTTVTEMKRIHPEWKPSFESFQRIS